ncbi:MAG: SH3 domain-containing protein [Deltaproteobacteria bacterium]|nr:SH3 domain-containing protein [Deltaproteobacteria bacterium]
MICRNAVIHVVSLYLVTFFSFVFCDMAMAAERCATSGEIANIRSGPGTKYDILYQAEKYYPLLIIDKSGNWYKIKDFEGDFGWVHRSLVSKIESVITTGQKCNIRSGPGTDYEILFVSQRGVPFIVLKRKGKWINVKHSEGHEGWIHDSLIW